MARTTQGFHPDVASAISPAAALYFLYGPGQARRHPPGRPQHTGFCYGSRHTRYIYQNQLRRLFVLPKLPDFSLRFTGSAAYAVIGNFVCHFKFSFHFLWGSRYLTRKLPSIEFFPLVLQFHQAAVINQFLDYLPAGTKPVEQLSHRLLPHGVHGSNT